jgi:hypothetical protein
MSEASKRVADAVKPALVKAISEQAYAALLAVSGFGYIFALPVVRDLTRFIIGRITQWAVQESAVGLSILWISIEMSYQIDSAEKAKTKLQEMLNNPQRYNEEAQKQIEEYFDKTTIDLIQLGIKRLA